MDCVLAVSIIRQKRRGDLPIDGGLFQAATDHVHLCGCTTCGPGMETLNFCPMPKASLAFSEPTF